MAEMGLLREDVRFVHCHGHDPRWIDPQQSAEIQQHGSHAHRLPVRATGAQNARLGR